MSKRFVVKDFCVYEEGNEIGMNLRDCCDKMNELYEENKELKEENEDLERFRYAVFKSFDKIYDQKK